MKWFKHETDVIHSEKMAKLIEEFGFEGYGRYWRIMEIIAERMDETDRCYAELPEREWLRYLVVRRPLFHRYLVVIGQLFDNKVITNGLLIRIEIPNLLKKRDNYTKNLQVTCKKLASKEVEVEVEVDKELKKSKNLLKNGSSKDRVLPLKKTPPKKPKTETTDTVKAERSWIESYEKAFGEKPSMSPSRDRSILKQLIKVHGLACVVERIPTHIAGRKMLTIGGFKIMFNDLGVTQRGGKIEAVEMDRKLDQLAQDRKKRIALGVEW
tara:strand:- start:506 stop:1309 length:804 start_codon:yes stop_codon:yes gene_type:complete